MHGGDLVNYGINLTNNSVLTVQQTNGIGLTFNGTSASSLNIDPSQINLIFGNYGWDFRWQDPSGGGNWIGTLDGLIDSGQILVTAPSGYSVFDQNGYTYIGFAMSSVPEPSSLVLACIASLGVMAAVKRQRRLRQLS